MGKIDKEKLLKEIKLKSDDVDVTWVVNFIKNFHEEPDQPIDFDALYKDLLKDCGDSCIKDESCKACVFDFLKSKNLTQPKPFEIPVKKTWTLISDYFTLIAYHGVQPIVIPDKDMTEALKPFYELHEEPDYSKIPKGSLVEFKENNNNSVYADYITHIEGDKIFCINGVYKTSLYNIRIVELAKE